MARKVFLSVLGTSFYETCVYGKTGLPTRFIQLATLLDINAKDWTADDRGFVFVTDKAKMTNWEIDNDKRLNTRTKSEEDYRGLKMEIADLKLPFEVKAVHIPDGKDESEIWTIFSTIYDQLEKGDELYIDLTHAFRYLPMLVLVLTNYSHFLKDTKVVSLSYGNYEARQNNVAPIVDLLPIAALQDWTVAAADYINNGYADRLKSITETTLKPLLRNEATRDFNQQHMRSFSSTIVNISEERILCRGNYIIEGKSVDRLVSEAKKIEKVTITPFKPIMDRILSTVDVERDSDIKKIINAARWCNNKHLYQQAITVLQEGIVTFFCLRHDIDINDEERRELVNCAFTIMNKNKKKKDNKFTFDENDIRKIIEVSSDEFFSNEELITLFANITDLRNDYNHSGFRKNKREVKTLTDSINVYIETAASILI